MSLDVSLSISVDTGGDAPYEAELFTANYTHNVTPMWNAAGVFDVLYGRGEWDNDKLVLAGALIRILEEGSIQMLNYPGRFRAMNPPNGWGDYDGALSFLERLLAACRAHPKATFSRCP